MKTSIIILALAVGADADYIDMRSFTDSEVCEGHADYVMNSFIGCTKGDGVSFRIQCEFKEAADYLYYMNEECSGDWFTNTSLPLEFGCDANANTSLSTYCEKGDFTPPSPAVNQYHYTDVVCPPAMGSTLTAVNSFPTGDCNHLDGGVSFDYGCTTTAMVRPL